ncbi:EAL and modified HD-GYP domain-containing signal transduction protein [Crenobacter luteus]|uniref:Diguanylate phosphodiesterase n=1 Tax=Crenobacter luteus TaxID=1452487 RepID=A0A163CLQ7_9NEIS|nr:EAL domain-containing protein [Crenobacter luteus]KZE32731.1 diguanylate phosphodiesterase [Crenobacter luteus]TCP12621.1 EAL and modified HD-GYP domain-containing signal transduction protein [Crenobacter luteus]
MIQTRAFIGRQPILDRNQQLIGYELLFRASGEALEMGRHAELEADTQVLLNTLNNMGTQWLVGNKLAFINVGEHMLMSEFVELLPARRVVLELSARAEPSSELISRLRYLRALGFSLSLDDFHFDGPQQGFIEHASYVKLDAQQDATAFQRDAGRLKSYPVTRIAERVETHAQFHVAHDIGFDAFQGFYFARPETLSAKVIHPTIANILELLNLIRQNEPVGRLEAVLKRDIALSYKLLRYVNSAAAGLNTPISSFSHAVTVLGYQKLYRWLTLLLVTSGSENTPAAAQKTAVTRGRFMELMGRASGQPQDTCDHLFVVGLFSLLDALFSMPMRDVLIHLHISDPIRAALEHRQGLFGAYLELAICCERQGLPNVERLSQLLKLSADDVNAAHVAALAWVEELGL